MNATVDIEYQDYAQAFSEFIRERGTLLPKALRGEGRQLASRLVRFTPPKTLSQGRKAVARDVRRAVLPLRPGDFDSKRIRQLIRKRDYAGLEAVFANFPESHQLHGVTVGEAKLPGMHQEARDRRGRVRKFRGKATPDADKVRDYIKEVQARVGRGRSGWAVALVELGGKPPAWVVRHAGRDTGKIEDRSDLQGYIRMENRSEWAEAGDEDRIVANAVRSRSRSIRESILKAQERAAQKARLN
ncbi:MAG: hypothetical protein KJ072_15660 [Verrucomicrobia bacterium]|nr:hypothetical protein [Verrucomicrobiota bacterium]